MFVNVGLGLISVLVTFMFQDGIRDNIRDKHPDDSTGEIDHLVNNTVVLTAVVLVIVVALYAGLAVQVSRGQQWARVATWALAAFSVIDAIGSLAGDDAVGSRVLGVTQGVIEVVIVVLLALRSNNHFFKTGR
jgi:uncharacterized membrane protein YhaH (DUF805 family)